MLILLQRHKGDECSVKFNPLTPKYTTSDVIHLKVTRFS